MSDLSDAAQAAAQKVHDASLSVQRLRAEAQQDIGASLWGLGEAVGQSRKAIDAAAEQQQELQRQSRFYSLITLWTRSDRDAVLQRCLSEVTGKVDAMAARAGDGYNLIAEYGLRASDLVSSSVKPAKDALETLQRSITSRRKQLVADLESLQASKDQVEKELESVHRDLAARQETIEAQTREISENVEKVEGLHKQKQDAESERQRNLEEARRCREDAESKRGAAIWVGLLSFGIGAIILVCQANECDQNARNAEARSHDLSLEITQAETRLALLEGERDALSASIQTLEASRDRLQSDREAHSARIDALQAEISGVQAEEDAVRGLSDTATKLDEAADLVADDAGALRRQLLGAKHKFDGLKAALEAHRDKTTFKIKGARAASSKDGNGRQQVAALLASAAEELEAVEADISKSTKLLGS